MSSGNLTGLAAIVGRSRKPETEQIDQDGTPAAEVNVAATPKKKATPRKPRLVQEAETNLAKYADPERVQLKVYVRRTVKVDALHKWQREGRGDLSDLVETLLTKYLGS